MIGSDEEAAEGVLLMEKHKYPKILCEDQLLEVLGMERHLVHFEPMVSTIVATVESEL
jgi:integrator complex subunit 11